MIRPICAVLLLLVGSATAVKADGPSFPSIQNVTENAAGTAITINGTGFGSPKNPKPLKTAHRHTVSAPGRALRTANCELRTLNVAASQTPLLQIPLVILLRPPERLRRLHLRHNSLRLVPSLVGELLNLRQRLLFLLRRVEEDH